MASRPRFYPPVFCLIGLALALPARGAERAKRGALPAVQPSEVLFSSDIGPVLLANCAECHGANGPKARFSLNNFDRLMEGGESGRPIEPGKPIESLLVQKLRGTGGDSRMPKGKPPFDEELIAKIEKWITEGAKFDGPDRAQELTEVVALAQAQAASHDELSRQRAELAAKNWRLVMPGTQPDKMETEHFLLYGNVGADELEKIGHLAEEQVSKVEKLLKLRGGRFIKGRMTLYVFQKHSDYSEVGQMLEHREIPAGSSVHWRYTVIDAYACLVLPKQKVGGLAGLLAQQIAGVCIAQQAKVPAWFSEGIGRAVAAKIDPKDPRVRGWDNRVVSVFEGSSKPDDFLTGKLAPQEAELVSYGFVKYLMSNTSRYVALLDALRSGTPFDPAFSKAYGATPNLVASNWKPRGRRVVPKSTR